MRAELGDLLAQGVYPPATLSLGDGAITFNIEEHVWLHSDNASTVGGYLLKPL